MYVCCRSKTDEKALWILCGERRQKESEKDDLYRHVETVVYPWKDCLAFWTAFFYRKSSVCLSSFPLKSCCLWRFAFSGVFADNYFFKCLQYKSDDVLIFFFASVNLLRSSKTSSVLSLCFWLITDLFNGYQHSDLAHSIPDTELIIAYTLWNLWFPLIFK